jgi:hypothetical protein
MTKQLAGCFRSDTCEVTEHRRVAVEDFLERSVSGGDFFRERVAAGGQGFQCP